MKLYGEKPVFVFETPGSYTVTLTTRDAEGLTSTDQVVVVIEEKSKAADLTLVLSGITVAAVIALVVALLWMRKRGASPIRPGGSS